MWGFIPWPHPVYKDCIDFKANSKESTEFYGRVFVYGGQGGEGGEGGEGEEV